MKTDITRILYQNSIDSSDEMVIRFENIEKVINLLAELYPNIDSIIAVVKQALQENEYQDNTSYQDIAEATWRILTKNKLQMKNILYKTQENPLVGVPYYLLIEGGQGHGDKNYGGTYKFVAGYFNPTQLQDRDGMSLEKWCDEKGLKFVSAMTFEDIIEKLEDFKL